MLSSLSCRFVKQEPSSSDKLSSRQGIDSFHSRTKRLVSGRNYSREGIKSNSNENNGPVFKINLNRSLSGGDKAIVHILFVTLFLATILIKGCLSEDRPCYCNGVFYPKCPLSKGCSPYNRSLKLQRRFKPEPPEFHDYEHPDHVIDDAPENSRPGLYDNNLMRDFRDEYPQDLDVVDDDERVVRHRKVYVSKRERALQKDPVIYPLELTIPVHLDNQPTTLPPPKPLFKMRKYTTYESQPEIVQVPVTTTIIKPEGVTKDQIVNEDSGSLLDKVRK